MPIRLSCFAKNARQSGNESASLILGARAAAGLP